MTKSDGIIRIGLCGKMRSGKDTVADRLYFEHDFEMPLAFGDSLKHYAHQIFPDVPKEPKPRELYQFMNVMRDYDPDVWVKHLADTVEFFENRRSTYGIVITDARQPNEVEWLRANGFTVVKVEADESTRIERIKTQGESVDEEALRHKTELFVDEVEADYVIENNGTLGELHEKVDDLVSNMSVKDDFDELFSDIVGGDD